MAKLLEPPKSAIETGYNITKAHNYLAGPSYHKAEYYIMAAIHCVPMAYEDINKVLKKKKRPLLYRFAQAPIGLLGKAKKKIVNRAPSPTDREIAIGRLMRAHELFSDLMEENGFRPITSEDFEEFGVGGGGR